jgi:hypothetical protein
LTTGTLPAGLTLNSSGLISGTPTATATNTPLTFTVTDTGSPVQTATASLTLTITAPAPTITTAALPDGVQFLGYSFQMTATGGTPPYSWSAPSGLPCGLTITTGGLIQGSTSSQCPSSPATIQVTDAASLSASVTLSVRIVRPLVLNTSALPDGAVGVPYSQQVLSIGGLTPLAWSATGLPAGLTIDSTGTISGTPTVAAPCINSVFVTVSDASNPTHQTASATYTMVISGSCYSGGTISVTSLALGYNLQDFITISLSVPAGSSGMPITITSGDASKLVLRGTTGNVSTMSATIGAGQQSIDVYVQALAGSGAVTVTAASVGASGQGTVTLSPSGFVVFAGANPGGSFNTTQGANTGFVVASARLDSSFNYVQTQAIRNGLSVQVPLTLSSPSVGTLSPVSAIFTNAASSVSVTFLATTTGNANPASTNITAGTPTSGSFSVPNSSANVLTAFVAGAGLLPCNTTVGMNLEALCNIQMTGAPSSDLTVTLVSNTPSQLLFSNTPDGVGQSSTTVVVSKNHTLSSDFYVYGLASSGSATYSAAGGTFGTVTGTVTFGPSGFVIEAPNGYSTFSTNTQTPVTISVFPMLLTSGGAVVSPQNVAGGSSYTVNITNTPIPPAGTVGTLNPSQVTVLGGTGGGSTVFVPTANVGSTTLAVVQPTGVGFTTPNQLTSVVGTVTQPGMSVLVPSIVGYHLQDAVLLSLGAFAAAGDQITITSNDPALALSPSPTVAGKSQITLTLNQNDLGAVFYVIGLDSFGSPTFTVTSPKFKSTSGTIQLGTTELVFGVASTYSQTLSTTVSQGITSLAVSTCVTDPFTGSFLGYQNAAAGFPTTIQFNNSDTTGTIGTISPQSVTFNGGDGTLNVNFTPKHTGNLTVSVSSIPAGFSMFPGFSQVAVSVN